MSFKLDVSPQKKDLPNNSSPKTTSKNLQLNSKTKISVDLYQHNENLPAINAKNKIAPNEQSRSFLDSINIFASNVLKFFKKLIKGKDRYKIEKSLLTMIENKDIVIPSLPSPYDSNKFAQIVPKVSKAAIEQLKKNDLAEVGIKSSKDTYIFVFMKNKTGKIDVLVKSALLGSGGSGDVFRAVSLSKQKEYVLKYAKDNNFAKSDLHFESRNLELLNHPGIQKKIKIACLSKKNAADKVVAKGKIYSKGDLQSQVIIKKLSLSLKLTPQEVLKLNPVELKEKLNKLVADNDQIVPDAGYELLGDKKMADFANERKRDSLLLELAEACLKLNYKPNINLGANLVGGLLHLHDQGMVHGDIKPKNFFFSEESAVIADFGSARLISDTKEGKFLTTTPKYATFDYLMAMRKYNENHNDSANWFLAGKAYDRRSMGLSLYEIYTGRELPSQSADASVYKQMKKHLIDEGVPHAAAKVIVKMCRPIRIDLDNLPNSFPTFVTDEELKELESALRLS